MREIKFRAWFDGEMHSHEDLVDMDQETHAVYTIITHKEQVNGDAFMQYTGLKDKNGREIYEGDVVKIIDDNEKSFLYKIIHFNYSFAVELITLEKGDPVSIEVGYEFGDYYHQEWTIESDDGITPLSQFLVYHCIENGIEVIGNIYENPELLEVAE